METIIKKVMAGAILSSAALGGTASAGVPICDPTCYVIYNQCMARGTLPAFCESMLRQCLDDHCG